MSKSNQSQSNDERRGVHLAPWEKAFSKVLTPFEEFVNSQTTSGLLLMATAILALVLANSGWAAIYQHMLHLPASITIGSWGVEKTLHHWVNDGLMAFFFFVVGLELKREILVGELKQPRQAALPILAAIGGMVVPALIYLLLNPTGEPSRGWGIPMATDIAFAIGALVLLGDRIPKALITFLVALAIVDDLGAVVVIAVFYTEHLVIEWLGAAVLLVAVLSMFNLGGIRRIWPYFIVAILLWYALSQSGVHATLAGVLGAFTVPARPKYDPEAFSKQAKALIERFDSSHTPGTSILANEELENVVQTMEKGVQRVGTPLQKLQNIWHLPVAFLVIPIFALFNAGIPMEFNALLVTLSHPVALGVGLGLVAGKFIGITGFSWLAWKLGVGQLPAGTRFSQIAGVSLLGGIGFTMAIFIAELGFARQPEYLLMAKTGILLASLLSGIAGSMWLYIGSARR